MRGRVRWPWILGAGLVALGMPVEGRSGTLAVVVRWKPSGDASIAGYRVYVRVDGGVPSRVLDVVGPKRARDGSLSAVLSGLETRTRYGVAVTAYAADGTESLFSNEMSWRSRAPDCRSDADCADDDACTEHKRCRKGRCLRDPVACPAGGPCDPATCDAQSGCGTTRIPDGDACRDADPCIIGSCAGPTCVPPAPDGASHDLAPTRFALDRLTRRRDRLHARGSFTTAAPIDPRASGATIELHDATGTLLYQATVPAGRFRLRGRRFTAASGRRWRSGGGAGIRRLGFTMDGDHAVWVTVDAVATDVLRDHSPTQLAWMVRLGSACVRAMGLVCPAGRAGNCL